MIHVRAVLLSILTLCICSSMAKRLKIRLVNGKHHYEGRIEVFHNDKWGEVCDHKWDLKGARVACRMLGFPDAVRYTSGDWYGRGTGFFWLDDVQCNGDEWSLDRCSRRDWGRCNCRRGQTAGVVCRLRDEEYVIKPIPFNTSQEIVDLPVRLLGPMLHDYISEGVLQVQVNKKWGYVCSEGWTDMNARVACGMLGYRDYFRGPPIRPTTPRKKKEKLKKMKNEKEKEKEDIFMVTNLKCAGHESSIVECHHDGWGPLKCERGFPVSIQCSRSAMFKNPKLRLRGSFRPWEGRVEVKSPKQKEKLHWGTVCDDHFDLKDANVVCRSLGLGTASRAFRGARFGQGSRSIYKDDVDCNGWEKDFDDCRSNTRSNCNHFEDASVQCNAPKLHNNKIRLAGGLSPLEGRVEVFDGIRWGAVCGENWGIEEATVACRHLGLGFAKDAVTRNSYFGVTSLRVIFSNVDCKLDELSLHHCERAVPERTSCLSGRKAGVICVRAVPDLVISVEELEKHVRIDAIPLAYMRCSYEENCLGPSARVQWPNNQYYTRRLLRFTTRVENRGLAAFRPDVPKSSWQWHECHNHYHSMEVFSTYDLVDTAGMKAAAGHKASFCLEDTICDKGIPKKFNCTDGGDQGISPNCYDVYKWNIDCQWIDVTDFPHGSFYLRVTVNPHRKVAESDYLNNIAKCELYDYGNFAVAARCHLEECISGMDTHGGNSKGACCVFPFKYRGRIFRSCTKSGYNRFWCATTSDFDRSRRWGICY